jgi:hypothetical protein
MIRRISFLVAVLALVVVFVVGLACDKDDEGNGPQPTPDEAIANAAVVDVLMPMIEGLNLNLYVASLPDSGHCKATGVCASGSSEACADSEGAVITFSDCLAASTVLTGSITLGESDTAALSLDLSGSTWTGEMTYGNNALDCFVQTLNSIVVVTPDYTMIVDGSLTYCDPDTVNGVAIPEIDLVLTLASEDRKVEIVAEDSEGFILSVGSSDTEFLLICNGSFYGGLPCFVPPTG